MNLSLLLGVYPAASAKASESRAFATAGQAFAPAGQADAAGATAVDGADTAALAGVFRSLVDELMLIGGEQRADDETPIAAGSVPSEADDFAATLEAADEADADEPEWNEAAQTPHPQVWLVELEIINRAPGVPTDLPRQGKSENNPTQDLSKESIEPDIALSALIATAPATLPQPVAPVPRVPSALGDPQSKQAPTDDAPQNVGAEMPADRPAAEATAFTPVPNLHKNTGRRTSESVETVPDSKAQPRTASAKASTQPVTPQPVKDAPTAPTMVSATESVPRSPYPVPGSQLPVSGSQFPVPGSGFKVPRSGVTKPEGATQNPEPGTLHQNEEPGTGNQERIQNVIARDSVNSAAPELSTSERRAKTEPKADAQFAQASISTRAGIVLGAASTKSSGDAPDRRHQAEPHATIPRPVMADVQTLGTMAMTSAGHELLSARTPPVSQPAVIVAPVSMGGSALPEETANQIVQGIRFQVIRGGGEATIRLEPKHFGELSITVRVEQGQVNARIQAESPVVREYLQNHQGLLREGLADQQLTLGKFEIAEARAESRDAERRSAEERAFQGDRQSQQRRRQQSPNTPFEPFEVVA